MAYTTIDDGSEYFQTAIYSGNSSTLAVTSQGNATIAPDWVWVKRRNSSSTHALVDSSRGRAKSLGSEANDPEFNTSATDKDLISFDTDGFTVGQPNQRNMNGNGDTFVAWQWKANGGTTTTNDASSTGVGTIDSVYQANTTAGFSIVTYTGTGSNGSVAHGLGAKPNVILLKDRAGFSWVVYHDKVASDPATDYLELNGTIAATDYAAHFNDTEPTSTVFSLGTDGAVNGSSRNVIAYCFAEKKGYSKFGSFIGNNSSDGAFVYLGFKPRWIMVKNTTQTHDNHDWIIFDSARETNNEIDTFKPRAANALDKRIF